MKRSYSLQGRSNYYRVLKRGKRFSGKGIRLIILKEREIEGLLSGTKGTTFSIGPKVKIGISISSKYGNAIIRNKTKRRIRAICREFLPDMEEGYFIILRPTEDFKDMDFERSKINIRQILGKAGVLKQ